MSKQIEVKGNRRMYLHCRDCVEKGGEHRLDVFLHDDTVFIVCEEHGCAVLRLPMPPEMKAKMTRCEFCEKGIPHPGEEEHSPLPNSSKLN